MYGTQGFVHGELECHVLHNGKPGNGVEQLQPGVLSGVGAGKQLGAERLNEAEGRNQKHGCKGSYMQYTAKYGKSKSIRRRIKCEGESEKG